MQGKLHICPNIKVMYFPVQACYAKSSLLGCFLEAIRGLCAEVKMDAQLCEMLTHLDSLSLQWTYHSVPSVNKALAVVLKTTISVLSTWIVMPCPLQPLKLSAMQ
jgi:hypothetical protein